jgi:predicted RNA-binding Zn-ribbon protein involved in translation (DUF1610 family)
VGASPLDDTYGAGFIPGAGTYFCLSCGGQLSLRETDELPRCSNCGDSRYRRDSIFESMRDHGSPTSEQALSTHLKHPAWLEEARRSVDRPGHHLAFRDEGEIVSCPIERGWTRIGRSATADVFLDDPSVSRRHAMIVAEPGKPLQVLDDRSLNGVFLNGQPVELAPLRDGDEIAVGRFRLYLLRP